MINTHLKINESLCGKVVTLSEGSATVEMVTTGEMVSDEQGLVHGGFVFGMADYAAMLAVNDPYVVLGAAETRFLKPLKVGAKITAQATTIEEKGKKRQVEVTVSHKDSEVFTGTFTCFVLDEHVLANA